MLCRDCNVVMKTGTSYQQKRNDKDKCWKRFNKCPKCHTKFYTKAPNFQEVLVAEINKVEVTHISISNM